MTGYDNSDQPAVCQGSNFISIGIKDIMCHVSPAKLEELL